MTGPLDAMWARWNRVKCSLFPWLREEVEPMPELLGRLIAILDGTGLEAFVPEPPGGAGRPPGDRRGLARVFAAKAVPGIPAASALIDRLGAGKSLRRVCGWERRAQVPLEANFSRACTEFAQGELPGKMHAAPIGRAPGGRSTGFKETWAGCKLHIDAACGQIPVSCVLTSASVHDSQATIPLMTMTSALVFYLYGLMDAAYDGAVTAKQSKPPGHVPLINRNFRGQHEAKAECAGEAARMKLTGLSGADDALHNFRAIAGRVNARLKDESGGRFVRARGAIKVKCHLMSGTLVLAAARMFRAGAFRPAST